MTEDYCKLVSGIILSTIWREDDHTRILWVTMLAVKDRKHRVMASVPGLAAVANLPVESVRSSLMKLMEPDPDSRTKDNEGKRISEIDGGWFIINGEKYRNFLSKAERNEYQAKLMADRRAKAKESQMLAPVSKSLAPLAQAETDTETINNPLPPSRAPRSVGISESKNGDNIPTTDQSKRIATVFHRKLTTVWTDKEIKAYSKIGTLSEDDLSALEGYYGDNWPPERDRNVLRHDLATFLNNITGEIDRANAWKVTRGKPSWQDSLRNGTYKV